MSDLSLRLTITAIENATKALERIAKQTEDTNKRIGKSNEYWLNKDKREQEKHEHWKTNLVEREEQKRTKLAEKAAREEQKRIKLAEKEAKEKRQALLQTEKDFRTSSQKMALYTTAPATIMSTLGMRSYMEMEKRQARMKMHFGKEAADMEKFAEEYALNTAFSVQNTTDLLEVIALGRETLGIKSNQEIKDLSKIIGDVVLAYGTSAEEQARIVDNIRQMMNMGRLELTDAKQMAKAGLNIERLAKMAGIQRKGETWASKEIIQIFKFAQTSDEVQTKMIENAKTFSQAWGMVGESIDMALAGYGKTLDKQFDLTNNTKIFASLLQKIGKQLKSDDDNLTKRMASYLTMLALTVAPTLVLIGHWRKISFLIGESNMKGGVLVKRLLMVGGAMSALYLTTVNWNKVWEDIKENPVQGVLTHLDTAIALAFTLSGAFVGIGKILDLLNTKLLGMNKTLTMLGKSPVLRMTALAFTTYDMLTDDELLQKNLEKVRSGNNGGTPLMNLSNTPANPKNIEMLANLQSQPKVEVINNINVDKSGNVSVETKTKDKNTYISPYSAPVMSDFSLGY